MSRLALHLLGAPYIECDGALVSLDTRKALALCAYLAVNSGYQARDALAALLWPESDQTAGRGALRRTLSVLNAALEGVGLEIEREAIAFNPDKVCCDWHVLQGSLRECQTHGHPAREVCIDCLDPLQRAVEAWNGDFMAGFSLRDSAEFDYWQSRQAEHARRSYASVLQRLVQLRSEAGDYEDAVEIARRWLALDALNETAHRQLIQLYAWAGQRELAIHQYRDCVRTLDQELGTPPLEATNMLYRQVLEDRLEAPQPNAALSAVREISQVPAKSPVHAQEGLPLVGREDALAQLEVAWAAVQQQDRAQAVVCIEGEAGIGKTRLIEAFLESQSAGPSIIIHCYESEMDLAYAPVIRTLRAALAQPDWLYTIGLPWLNELVRLLPDIVTYRPDLDYQPVVDSVAAQSRLIEAIAQAFDVLLDLDAPALLVMEDLQWVDHATLDFLSYYLRRQAPQAALHLLTWRSGRGESLDRLRAVLAEFARAGGAVEFVHLDRLDESNIQELAQSAGVKDARLVERLYDESEGLPFFLVELLPLVLSGDFNAADADESWTLPRSTENLLRARLASIGESLRQLLGAASVIGRAFDDQILQECSGRSDEEVVDGLDALLAQGLLVANQGRSDPSYDFFHDTLRRLVYDDLNTARRRLLHKRAAAVLLSRMGSQAKPSPFSSEIAHHLAMSGNEAEAARYYFDAGVYARHLFANYEAIHHFQMALAMYHPDAGPIYQQLGDVYLLIGDYGQAAQSYETALAHGSDAMIGPLEHAIGCVYHRTGEWELAENHFQRALDATVEQEASAQASILLDWSLTAYNRKALDEAEDLAQAALDLSRVDDDPASLAQCHNIMGILARHRGDLELARQHHLSSLETATALGISTMEVAIRNNLALTLAAEGQMDGAEAMLLRALALCEQQGDRHRAAALHNNLADLYHQVGQQDAAMEQLKQAVSLFAQIGDTVPTQNAEIWRLSEW